MAAAGDSGDTSARVGLESRRSRWWRPCGIGVEGIQISDPLRARFEIVKDLLDAVGGAPAP